LFRIELFPVDKWNFEWAFLNREAAVLSEFKTLLTVDRNLGLLLPRTRAETDFELSVFHWKNDGPETQGMRVYRS
jgi:hypothetical protein